VKVSSRCRIQADYPKDESLPEGWTDDKDELDYEANWSEATSYGSVLAAAYELKSPQPVICSTRQSGDAFYIFQSEGKFYIWNQIEGSLFCIDSPTTLDGILKTIKAPGLGGLKVSLPPLPGRS
jgi:hypothetical protein